ncbi:MULTISPECIES: carboxymuconolactone decarboxylase family protein [unclassified Achromobacter]|uniref:carboxymuconolactone decarboxylase family protein n=1 Tax=unclassified Achromobacter TaxID=2626865 RepID=UPI000B517C38|nr:MULTISPECIES: carboxymuconolactone decarboxylase family protein [unclassified Achromobacter]OWT80995.1 carboxymuconolactone decarboxylase [Achromobacter sp. HZ34]OWT81511.1 carboxymuconolactone decarboxylase [Achromobacter sp. HZ28]
MADTHKGPRVAPVVPGTRPELAEMEARIMAERGRISPLYQVLLNSPAVVQGWEAMLTAIRNRIGLSPRLRELVILRVAVLNRAPYEFEAHVPHALKAGMDDALVEALRTERAPVDIAGLTAQERDVVAFTDAMTRDIDVSDACYDALAPSLGEQGMVELAATVAAYNMVSRFLSALRIGH